MKVLVLGTSFLVVIPRYHFILILSSISFLYIGREIKCEPCVIFVLPLYVGRKKKCNILVTGT